MNKVGTLIRAVDIGRKGGYKYIFLECLDCKKQRWVALYSTKRRSYTGLCHRCSIWKGGRNINQDGYMQVMVKNHPLANIKGYILEHRLIAAKEWGMDAVRGMDVHHINENITDNRIENLQIVSRSEHNTIHKTKALKEE